MLRNNIQEEASGEGNMRSCLCVCDVRERERGERGREREREKIVRGAYFYLTPDIRFTRVFG